MWENVEVTAVELNPQIAEIYQDFFPNDKVIVGDAHEYLLKHYKEFDFIWTSPPCPTHSRTNHFLKATQPVRYIDAQLIQQIVLLKSFFTGKFCVENVISYYEPIYHPQKVCRHYFWANFLIAPFYKEYKIGRLSGKNQRGGMDANLSRLEINLDKYTIGNKRLLLRNCVPPELGLHIFNCAKNQSRQPFEMSEMEQVSLFG